MRETVDEDPSGLGTPAGSSQRLSPTRGSYGPQMQAYPPSGPSMPVPMPTGSNQKYDSDLALGLSRMGLDQDEQPPIQHPLSYPSHPAPHQLPPIRTMLSPHLHHQQSPYNMPSYPQQQHDYSYYARAAAEPYIDYPYQSYESYRRNSDPSTIYGSPPSVHSTINARGVYS
jgi:hypothetical protein